jgi:hypothetical protein
MDREITQFSYLEYNNASDEDIESNPAPKFEAMRLFEAEAERGDLKPLGGPENIKRVRLMDIVEMEGKPPVRKLVYDTKRPAGEVLAELRGKALADLFYGVAPLENTTVLLAAAKLFESRAGTRDITPEDKELATRCVMEVRAGIARAARQKPVQESPGGPRNARKHQGRGKSHPVVERIPRRPQGR